MNVKQLKELIKDMPDDTLVVLDNTSGNLGDEEDDWLHLDHVDLPELDGMGGLNCEGDYRAVTLVPGPGVDYHEFD